jgi:hypothetical protein
MFNGNGAMSQSTPPFALMPADYIAIEKAILQSSKGRGFLADYLLRNRTAETEVLLAAIAKLHRALDGMEGARQLARLKTDLVELQRNMARARRELAAMLLPEDDAKAAGVRADKLDAAFSHVESEIMARLDMWDYEAEPAEKEVTPLPPALETALRKGLIEELTFAMLSDAQKAALFN